MVKGGNLTLFFGALAQYPEANISLVLSSCPSVRLSVRPSILSSFRHEILHLIIFRKFIDEVQVSLKYDKNKGHLTWSLWNLLWTKHVSDKSCGGTQNFMFKIVIEPDRSQLTMWPMSFACCKVKATDTHSEYVILIAFPRYQLFPQYFAVRTVKYIACLVFSGFGQRCCRGLP